MMEDFWELVYWVGNVGYCVVLIVLLWVWNIIFELEVLKIVEVVDSFVFGLVFNLFFLFVGGE